MSSEQCEKNFNVQNVLYILKVYYEFGGDISVIVVKFAFLYCSFRALEDIRLLFL